jgi:hypothetical protein
VQQGAEFDSWQLQIFFAAASHGVYFAWRALRLVSSVHFCFFFWAWRATEACMALFSP